jgi:adenine/guanine phosphoribosyltransferase-like PRPP-binding protein
MRKSLYVPKAAIKKKDSVLIIDDVVRTGETVQALVDLVRNQRADIAGIYVLVTVGDEWKECLDSIISKYSFEVLIEI